MCYHSYDHCHHHVHISGGLASYLHMVIATQPTLRFANSFGANDPELGDPIHTRATAVMSYHSMDLANTLEQQSPTVYVGPQTRTTASCIIVTCIRVLLNLALHSAILAVMSMMLCITVCLACWQVGSETLTSERSSLD